MRILVFDSGLGGLTVLSELRKALPQAHFVYAADDAAFPYGAWTEDDLVWRVVAVFRRLVAHVRPDVIVIACNTASTLVLPHVRAVFADIPIIGTVPAVKPIAERTKSRLVSVLATPGTVSRDYTRDLIASFAQRCEVKLVGSKRLAGLAEDFMRGRAVADNDVAAEIAPCFAEQDGRRTDMIALACTHYPLLLEHFRRLAPWPVEWIDPAPAIARHTARVIEGRQQAPRFEERRPVVDEAHGMGEALFTSGKTPDEELVRALETYGLRAIGAAFAVAVS